VLGWGGAEAASVASPLEPADLAIYYGWPSLVNGVQNNADAAAVFGQYDIVIFNQGLEEPPHGDHTNTKAIIQLLQSSYSTRVFGYINGPQWNTSWALTSMPPTNWQGHVDLWVAMGVDGIFIDEFGYDWGPTRATQNAMLDAVHARGLPAFVNSWFIDHTFSSAPDPVFPAGNPNGVPSHIRSTDLYLLESFAIIEGHYDQCARPIFDTWVTKGDKALLYRQMFGTEMWAMTTADRLTTMALDAGEIAAEERLSFAWHATAMYGLNGFGWTEPQFSASGPSQNLLPWRLRPDPNPPVGIGSRYLNGVQHNGDTHTRDTDVGQFRVVCNDNANIHTAQFTPTPCTLAPYDFDGNGVIDIVDIAQVSSRFMDPARYEVRFDVAPAGQPDGVIDIADIAAVASRFGQTCP
jgi:hypothetical protein